MDTQNDGLGKVDSDEIWPYNMAICGIYVKFLGCSRHILGYRNVFE